MDGELHVDIALLRQHGAEVQQERYVAERLCEQLKTAQRFVTPEDGYRYDAVIRRADSLVHYLQEMEEAVDNMSVEFETLSHQMYTILESRLEQSLK